MSSSHRSNTWIGRSVGDRDRYRLEEHLGGGGMGDVFLATDTLLGKQVALKLLKGALVDVEGFSKRFSREVALCAALKSDHIVQVSDYGMTANGEPFYVMEHLEGETLGQRLAQQQRLSPQEAIGIIIQVCRGLQVAHEGVKVWKQQAASSTKSRIVHRDLKPENIYLVPTVLGDLVKIIDFGIAKIYNEQQQQLLVTNLSYSNQFLGTFRYASPEQWENRKELDGRSDIYSLGMIFYEMLSGNDPFDSETNQADAVSIVFWATAHTKQPPKPLRSQPGCTYISPELEAVVMRCLEKSPDRRFATVTELIQAIVQAAVESNLPLSISIPPPPPQDASTPTEVGTNLETEVGKFDTPILDSSFSETIASAHIPLTATEPTRNVFPSQPIDSETTQGGRVTPNRRTSILKVVAGTSIIGVLTGISYVYWQGLGNNSNRSSNVAILEEVKTLKSQAKYEECITKSTSATSSVSEASINSDLQVILNQCQLERAKQLAAEQKFDIALARIAQIPANSSSYGESQQLIKQWSEKAFTLAAPKYQNGDLNGAIALLNAIPKTSPSYTKAQTAMSNWKKEWQTAELNFKAAQSALKNNNLPAALDATNKIPKIAFWQKKVKPIVDDVNSRLAKTNQPNIIEPSSPTAAPAPINTTPNRIPEAPTSVQPEAPVAPPDPNPVYTVPPNQTLGEEQPSSNKRDEGI